MITCTLNGKKYTVDYITGRALREMEPAAKMYGRIVSLSNAALKGELPEEAKELSIPDAMDEVIYLNMEDGIDELSDSYLGDLLSEYTGENLVDYFTPTEDLDFMEYCSDELMALYDSMEVKKDGSQKLTIDGKSQNCTQYQVLIPGDCLVDLFEAMVEYSADLSPAVELALRESHWEDFIRSFEIEDMELTMCLDKKGRLVASEERLRCTPMTVQLLKSSLTIFGCWAAAIPPIRLNWILM